jgi:hypothetical protein
MIWLARNRVFLKQIPPITFAVSDNKLYHHSLTLKELFACGDADYLAPMELAAWKN